MNRFHFGFSSTFQCKNMRIEIAALRYGNIVLFTILFILSMCSFKILMTSCFVCVCLCVANTVKSRLHLFFSTQSSSGSSGPMRRFSIHISILFVSNERSSKSTSALASTSLTLKCVDWSTSIWIWFWIRIPSQVLSK